MVDQPDFIVFRHGPDIPREYWHPKFEGYWIDKSNLPVRLREGPIYPGIGVAIAEPANRFEVRDSDGAVAEIWEIRLMTPNEKRQRNA